MNILRKSLLSVAVCASLIATGCSSSNDNTVDTTGSAELPNDPSEPVTGEDVTTESGTDNGVGAPTVNSGTTPTGTGALNLPVAYPDLLRALAGVPIGESR